MKLRCKKCGNSFENGFRFSQGTKNTISNVGSECPNCGTMNYMRNGIFDFDSKGNVIKEYLENIKLTASEIGDLKSVLQSVNVNTPISSISSAATDINPKLSEFFKIFSNKLDQYGGLMAFISLLLTLLQILTPSEPQVIVNNNYYQNGQTPESFSQKKEREGREKSLFEIQQKQDLKHKIMVEKLRKSRK